MNYNSPVKKSLLNHHASGLSKEKVLTPEVNRSMNLQDKGRLLKSGKLVEQGGSVKHAAPAGKIDSGNSVPPIPLGNRHKPWPGRKVTGVEEVVKYMSSVPCYLKQMERVDTVQGKALNFGVLDWGRLEKWSYIQKQVENRRGGDSPSSSGTSSSFSTFGSSSQSCRSSGSPLALRKESPTSYGHRISSSKCSQTKMIKKENSGHMRGFPDPRTSPAKTSSRHIHELDERKGSDMRGISCSKSQPAEVGSSIFKDYEMFTFKHNKGNAQTGTSGEVERLQTCEQNSCPGDLHLPEHWLQEQCSSAEGMWDHLQERVNGRRISFGSTVCNNGGPVEVNRKSFSGNFPPEDVQFTSISPHIPHSWPLSTTTQCDEPAITDSPTAKFKVKYEKHEQFASNYSAQSVVNLADDCVRYEVKANAAPRREQSYHHASSAGPNWMSRSSSSRERLSGQQMKQAACADNSHEDKARSNSRGRRSPLRRMLDPLLKSKSRVSFSGPITSSTAKHSDELGNMDKFPVRKELTTAKGSCKSSDRSTNCCPSQATNSKDSVQEELHVASTGKALLKLAWKNGLPLFMLSSSDNNILAATIGKRSVSSKNDVECIYTIFTAHEVKKKSGIWISQGHKGKQHGLVYTVVGQIKVSCSKLTSYDSKSQSVVREFVLFGAELIPRTHELGASLFKNELAAIVVKAPNERPENYSGEVLQGGNSRDSLKKNSVEDQSSCCKVECLKFEHSLSSLVAILPRGVHGLSSSGEPSPLIERWKSGGSCDCGGWDEGCMLTVLTNEVGESQSSGSVQGCCTTDGTHRIELFIQGETREIRHAFSMVAFKEGLYTVDFGSSIALLQAFAICIATLHCRKFGNPSELHYSVEAKSLQDHIFADYPRMAPARSQGGVPTSYVPHHPPHSPVGRA